MSQESCDMCGPSRRAERTYYEKREANATTISFSFKTGCMFEMTTWEEKESIAVHPGPDDKPDYDGTLLHNYVNTGKMIACNSITVKTPKWDKDIYMNANPEQIASLMFHLSTNTTLPDRKYISSLG